jgi:aspartyl-tRNA(Asn)/glutamyl-tRNA(Gln) amidotransferase subunit B
MSWEVVIGLETHAQLSTVSKIFSGASTAFGAAPNTHASAIDIALPGTLPSLNKGAVERAIKFGLAVDGAINRRSVFARKNYFYPDLPKGYQISQYEIPIVQGGKIRIVSPTRGEIDIQLTRAHLEEDAGKSLHEDFRGMTGIDLNRAGTPLLEIVSEPELRSAEEAVAYAKTLHGLVRWIGICDGNMQEGSFRFDANVSVRPLGDRALGTRCEIKNLNSFRFLQQAITFEARRQTELIEDGGRVVQETRLFDPERGETRPMRSKEDAQDYRYFPDPDLPPLVIGEDWIASLKAAMPELPETTKARLIKDFALPSSDANQLVTRFELVRRFENLSQALAQKLGISDVIPEVARMASNWILGEEGAALNRSDLDVAAYPVSIEDSADLLLKLHEERINARQAKEVFAELWRRGLERQPGHVVIEVPTGHLTMSSSAVDVIIAERGLEQISDAGAIEKLVDGVLAANASIVAEYRSGKQKAFNSLVGKVMAASKGKANPAQVNAILRRKLS